MTADMIIRDELLLEAHELLAVVLLRGALQYDIKPEDPIGQRILAFNKTVRSMGIVRDTQQVGHK